MIAFPNAKINLGLYVVKKRHDGYHDISTIMVPVNWCDILEIVPERKEENSDLLTITGNAVQCETESNLVVKALRKIEKELGRNLEVEIFLRKVIPDGAGLGGGSSDASFTLKLLDMLFSLDLGTNRMMEIAAELGADCPFFLLNQPARAQGIGDEFTPLSLPLSGWHIVLVKPQEKISTARAYEAITPSYPEVPLTEAVKKPVEEWKDIIFNDFEKVAFNIYPNLKDIKTRLYETGAIYASMSGSGSAFFGLYPPHYDKLTETKQFFGEQGYITYSTQLIF